MTPLQFFRDHVGADTLSRQLSRNSNFFAFWSYLRNYRSDISSLEASRIYQEVKAASWAAITLNEDRNLRIGSESGVPTLRSGMTQYVVSVEVGARDLEHVRRRPREFAFTFRFSSQPTREQIEEVIQQTLNRMIAANYAGMSRVGWQIEDWKFRTVYRTY